MATPKKSGKGKQKKKATEETSATDQKLFEQFLEGVDPKSPNWRILTDRLQAHFGFGDLSTKKAFREAHQDFDTVAKRINEVFDKSHNPGLQAAIVLIWGKLCIDAVLRDKLIEQGILKRMVDLLLHPITQKPTLQALLTITEHGSINVRVRVAVATTTTLVVLLEDNRTHEKSAELDRLCIGILGHAIESIFQGDTPVYRQACPDLPLQDLLLSTLQTFRHPDCSLDTFTHGLSVLTSTARHGWKHFKENPQLISALVAFLRVKDVQLRGMALLGILGYQIGEHGIIRENRSVDVMKNVKRGIPEPPQHLLEKMFKYGYMQCELFTTMTAIGAFQKAQQKVVQTGDYCELGLTTVKLILTSEAATPDGTIEVASGPPLDLPYKSWVESLPYTAKCLRERDAKKYADEADILDIKYAIVRQNYDQVRALCEFATKRSPNHQYWYYARALACTDKTLMSRVKRGLACRPTYPYIQHNLLERSVEVAFHEGLELIEEGASSLLSLDRALSYFIIAVNDGMKYLNEAPPDARAMQKVLSIVILIKLVTQGPDEISADLKELQPLIKEFNESDELYRIMTDTIPSNTQTRLTYKTILSLYTKAAREWDDPYLANLSRQLTADSTLQHDSAIDQVQVWLDAKNIEEGQAIRSDDKALQEAEKGTGGPVGGAKGCWHPNSARRSAAVVDLGMHTCSFCGNPSANLKKCGRCEKARYCNADCQKEAWKGHKKICKNPNTT